MQAEPKPKRQRSSTQWGPERLSQELLNRLKSEPTKQFFGVVTEWNYHPMMGGYIEAEGSSAELLPFPIWFSRKNVVRPFMDKGVRVDRN